MAKKIFNRQRGAFAGVRVSLRAGIASSAGDTPRVMAHVSGNSLPDDLSLWLGRLRLLYGAPIHYLVPDEAMLPPESIRFFYLDPNWINALVDGAYSIGRNLTQEQEATLSVTLDAALQPAVREGHDSAAAAMRGAFLGEAPPPYADFSRISGFLLRSSIVVHNPGIGVEGFAKGSTTPLPILRMERLGVNSDTLICLFNGDAAQVDIHEPPEALHYGIDAFSEKEASKKIYLFKREGNVITMSKEQVKLDLKSSGIFRTSDARTMKMSALANLIAQSQKPPLSQISSAEMGFEMTEGVGKVSFTQESSAL